MSAGIYMNATTEQYVYFGCFLFGLLFTVLSVFFGHHLGGHDADVGTGGHAEAGYEHTGMPGMSPFSPTTICAFITAFGGFGLIFSHIAATSSVWVSTPLSLFGGMLVAAAVLSLFSFIFSKTQSSSEGHLGSMVGHTATVITPIPPAGVGEIAYVQGGSRYTAPAREQNGAAVANGQTVTITRIAESQFFVSAV
jgi:membrane protein implicated in regulation of membrane protease activity